MWIVMTSTAKMPSSCWGRYRNVALVEVNPYAGSHAHQIMPRMIHPQHKAVKRIVHLGHHNVGSTPRCAYNRALAEANRRCEALNSIPTVEAGDALLMSWGGSA